MSGSVIEYVSSEFNIFTHRPIHMSALGTVEIVYKPIGPVDQNDLRFRYLHRFFYKTLLTV